MKILSFSSENIFGTGNRLVEAPGDEQCCLLSNQKIIVKNTTKNGITPKHCKKPEDFCTKYHTET